MQLFYFLSVIIIIAVLLIYYNTNIKSSYVGFDTRFLPAFGKFIQITRKSNTSSLNIASLQIYTNFYYGRIDFNDISAVVQTYLNSTNLFSNALYSNDTTLLSVANTSEIFIHIDLGPVNKIVTGISLKMPLSDQLSNLLGLVIRVIQIDENKPFDLRLMKVTSEVTIDQNMINSYVVQDNMYYCMIALTNNKNTLLPADVVITKELLYNDNNKYLTTYYKNNTYYQVPYMIYTMGNGRKVLSKKLVSVEGLDQVNASDANFLFNINTNDSLESVKTILTPITARYIQLMINNYNIDKFIKIIVYNSSKVVIKEFTSIKLSYINSDPIYSNYLTDISGGNGFIFLDLEQNIPITFINIKTTEASAIINATLNLFNANLTKVFTYNFITPNIDTYVITDYNIISINDNSIPSTYYYPNCQQLNICNNVAPNTKYVLPDNRCFLSKSNSICGSNCMRSLTQYPMNVYYDSITANFNSCLGTYDTRLPPFTQIAIWFDSKDTSTMFKNSLGTIPITSNGDNIVRWNSKGAIENFYMLQLSGTATYIQNIFGDLPTIKFNNFIGGFSDAQVAKFNNGGITMFVVINNFMGTPSTSNGGSFWFQSKSDNYCNYNYVSTSNGLTSHVWYEQMGATNSSSMLMSVYDSKTISNDTIVYAVRADSINNFVKAYFNSLVPFQTLTKYGTLNLTTDAYVGGNDTLRCNICEFKLYQRRMEDIEFANIFNDLKIKWNRLIAQFDASNINTLYTDVNGTIQATKSGDIIRSWRTTDSSALSVLATYISQGQPVLTTAFINKYVVNIDSGAFKIPINFGNFNDISYIAAFKQRSTNLPHVMNYGNSWINYNGYVYEYFFTNNNGNPYTYMPSVAFNNISNAFPFIIYALTANSTTRQTICYAYTDNLYQLISLPYSKSHFSTNTDTVFNNITIGDAGGNTYLTLLDLKIFNTVMTYNDILSEVNKIKDKLLFNASFIFSANINTYSDLNKSPAVVGQSVRAWETINSDSVMISESVASPQIWPTLELGYNNKKCIAFNNNSTQLIHSTLTSIKIPAVNVSMFITFNTTKIVDFAPIIVSYKYPVGAPFPQFNLHYRPGFGYRGSVIVENNTFENYAPMSTISVKPITVGFTISYNNTSLTYKIMDSSYTIPMQLFSRNYTVTSTEGLTYSLNAPSNLWSVSYFPPGNFQYYAFEIYTRVFTDTEVKNKITAMQAAL